jgi:heat-inducible transcriptional repressor
LQSVAFMDNQQNLNDRSLQLLKKLVERYINSGQPVGSKALAQDLENKLSPATIRNVMADLEELGLIYSPHHSAGRVPTVSGYRLFVDNLVTVKPLAEQELSYLQHGLEHQENSGDIVAIASKILSDVTKMAGIVTLPRREMVCITHLEFLPLSHNRVLVILVTDDNEVHNKIIQPNKVFTTSELQQTANYLNAVFSGRSLVAAKEMLLNQLQQDRQRLNQEMQDVINIAQQVLFPDMKKEDFILSGETNLMSFADLSSTEKLKQLFEAFNQKHGVIQLLDQCLTAEGVQIFIGEESGYQAFEQCSLVTRTYSVNDEVLGVLGVIGPTRMAYEKVISCVDVTAKLLGAALNPKS